MSNLSESITNVSDTVDDIIKVFEEDRIKKEYNKSSSFYSFMFHLTLKVISIVEELMTDTSGSIKKYVVVKVMESIIKTFFPTYLQFFNDNIDDIIETLIESFYLLQKFKKDRLIGCSTCCFPIVKNNIKK
jgi:hypothetical protein